MRMITETGKNFISGTLTDGIEILRANVGF